MSGDYTRNSFSPAKGFSGVHKQQGRVNLESEFNEFEQILDRRDRAQMYDTLGPHPGRAIVPRTNPNAFSIQVNNGALTIGVGRAYVDGILVELFGESGSLTEFDPIMGNLVAPGTSEGNAAITIGAQPFAYNNPAMPMPMLLPPEGSGHIFYLDVWQREVTVFEDPSLLEPALNGADTATRVQTAWQVKVLPGQGTETCAAPGANWNALVAPSTGRLTVKATQALIPPGACVIESSGGYLGYENRLYRVEIHAAGTTAAGPGAATFKWSRDNASVAAAVLAVSGLNNTTVITVSSTGPDIWRRFAKHDHIELLDDDIEFSMRETGVGGPMLRVTLVDLDKAQITVEGSLVFPVNALRHPRIRRWDVTWDVEKEDEPVGPLEPLTRPASGTIPLENGISIEFGGPNGTLHAGDYWVFAARTVDGSVETLTDAPPRGILHHFARLAVAGNGAITSDCRIHWPPPVSTETVSEKGCCTVVVEVGQSIQDAINSLPDAGGCVCLKMGVHVIHATLIIGKNNLTLHAEAPRTTIHLQDTIGARALNVLDVSQVAVRGIHFVASTLSEEPLVAFENVRNGTIVDCRLDGSIPTGDPLTRTGALFSGCESAAIEQCEIDGCRYGIRSREGGDALVVRCRLANGVCGVSVGRVTDRETSVVVKDNWLTGWGVGIQVSPYGGQDSGAVRAVVTGNRIVAQTTGIELGGLKGGFVADNEIVDCVTGIELLDTSQCAVERNRVVAREVGVYVPGLRGRLLLCGNRLWISESREQSGIQIYGSTEASGESDLVEAILESNVVDMQGAHGHGVAIRGVRTVRVHDCIVRLGPRNDGDSGSAIVIGDGDPGGDPRAEADDFRADICDNYFEQKSGTVAKIAASEIIFEASRCRTGALSESTPAVVLGGKNILASNNRIENPRDRTSLRISASKVMAIGNVLGGILNAPISPSMQGLNLEDVQ